MSALLQITEQSIGITCTTGVSIIRTGCAQLNVRVHEREKLIGPYIIEGNLTGECYRNFKI
ncbi:hypothetical protein D910_09234 [Dendroctonus ponderosae]|uniref:Uncharacterized protein n=1 Tax=Dendroctonus ponderosae TaxID=77166 RepID=U4UP39_DENPD|nr:hypothetical protein D910_09234 [Dendroctonus ponderosae]